MSLKITGIYKGYQPGDVATFDAAESRHVVAHVRAEAGHARAGEVMLQGAPHAAKVEVEFVRENAPYAVGDRASFAPDRADAFVAAGAARWPPDVAAQAASGDLPKRTTAARRYDRKAD